MNLNQILLMASAPNDLWNNLLNGIFGSNFNLGWAILLLTLIVKLATTPLDFMVKYSTKKQTLIQQKCAPQIAKLQKKFGNNQQAIRIQTNALYKREGLNVGTGCIVMLINLILTCTIFFSFYASLRTISTYQTIHQYEVTYESYQNSYINHICEQKSCTADEAKSFADKFDEYYEYISNESNATNADFEEKQSFVNENKSIVLESSQIALDDAFETWKENKSNWLWVKNIWVADAPVQSFPDYNSLKSSAANANNYYKDYINNEINENEYNSIANAINSKANSNNGFYILAILAGAITYLSSVISDLHNKLKNKNADKLAKATNTQNTGSMKLIKFILPVIMVIFVLTSSASFGIYILASSLASIVFGEIINVAVNKLTNKKRIEVEEYLSKEADRLIKKGKLKE